MNHITLMGRLTKDPEYATTTSNKKVAKFTLAVDAGKDNTDFITCVAWEQTADIIAKYTHKGERLAVEGRLSIRKVEKDGKPNYFTEVVVSRCELLSDKPKNDEPKPEPNFNTGKSVDIESDDLPF